MFSCPKIDLAKSLLRNGLVMMILKKCYIDFGSENCKYITGKHHSLLHQKNRLSETMCFLLEKKKMFPAKACFMIKALPTS